MSIDGSSPAPTLGSTIGHIRIESLLGRGGMGEVYLGYDPRLERRVAIKTIRREQRLSPVQKARLLREARLLGKLGHPAICQVYDLIETPEADYLVLEYIEGSTLAALARREALSFERKLDLAEKIANALAVAHREQVVHRDLKADNVMVTPAGEVKVLDFGIARSVSDPAIRLAGPPPLPNLLPLEGDEPGKPGELGDDPTWAGGVASPERDSGFDVETVGLTRHGVIVGSLQAMSPEQAAGGEVTTASDLYSFGILLQELLTGEKAYAAQDQVERLGQVQRAETRPLPASAGFDPDLVRLLRDLQSLDPRRRPSAEEAAEQIRALCSKPQRLRRQRLRRLALAAAFVLLAAGLAVVSWFAYQANLSRREAERRRRQAEGLIGFMLGDLRSRLERVNRLDVLDAVGDRALAYFGALPEGELTQGELVRRVEAVIQIGEVRYAQGNLAAALVAFRRAGGLAAQLGKGDPERPAGAKQLYLAQDWIGQTLYDQGKIEEALAAWSESRSLVQRQLALHPTDAKWLEAMATSHHNVGTIYELRGDLDGALREYQESLTQKRALALQTPADAEIQAGLAGTLAFVSNTLERKGDLAAAEAERRAYLAIEEGLSARDPQNPVRRYDLAVAQGFLAGLLAARGDRDEARKLYELGLETFDALAAGDPDNALNRRWLGAFQSALGALRAETGEARAAVGSLEPAIANFRALLAKDRANPDFRLQLGVSQNRLAQALESLEPGRALTLARAATATLAPLATVEADEPTRGSIAAAAVTEGRLEAAAGDPNAARAAWDLALAVLAPCRRPLTHWKILVPWAEAQLGLGAVEEARPAIEQLRRMGYARRDLEALPGAKGLRVPPP